MELSRVSFLCQKHGLTKAFVPGDRHGISKRKTSKKEGNMQVLELNKLFQMWIKHGVQLWQGNANWDPDTRFSYKSDSSTGKWQGGAKHHCTVEFGLLLKASDLFWLDMNSCSHQPQPILFIISEWLEKIQDKSILCILNTCKSQ